MFGSHRRRNSYHLKQLPLENISMTNLNLQIGEGFETRGDADGESFSGTIAESTIAIESSDVDDCPKNLNDDSRQREQWANPAEFLLTCIASSVGLGNVWKFPFVAYKNGGVAYLIPYILVLTIIGRPIYFLELVLGQFSSYGQVKVWKLAPFFKGLGYGSMLGMICLVSYYACLMGLTVFYCFSSFQSELPWSTCDDEWVSMGCQDGALRCNASDPRNAYSVDYPHEKSNCSIAQLYFENAVLQQKKDIKDGLGYPELRLSMCLLLTWLLIWGALVTGITSSGKIAYFTALFPYVVLIIMLIRGVTLPGAGQGILFFIEPDWEKMTDPNVWHEAVAQCFFSLSIGFGSIIMIASYSPFHYNVFRDAYIISILDTVTSLLAGVTIFAVLGNLSHELDIPMEQVAEKDGLGLAFISYPAAIAQFDWVTQLFAVLFYLMLFTLGVGSATSLVGAIVTVFCDHYPKVPQYQVTTVASIILFLIGLVYVTPGGQFILQLVDYFGANFVIYIITTIEVIAVAWVYGLNNLLIDIEFMLGVRIGWYWKICWGFCVPFGLTLILVYALVFMKPLTYNGQPFPDTAIACGWLIAAMTLATLPLFAFHAVKTRKSVGWMEKLKESFKPTTDWGPMKNANRIEWLEFKAKHN